MTTDDRKIDRKANTPTIESDQISPMQDRRPDLEHFSNFDMGRIRRRLPTVDLPSIPVVSAAIVALYAFVVVGALSVAYGATSLAAAHGGFYVALIVAGVFAFAYGYIALQAIATAREPDLIEP